MINDDLCSECVARASGVSASKNPSTDDQVPLERSQSEYPTLTEAVANLSISSESQTSRPSNRRQGIYSVVPETAVLTPIRRSDPAEKLGRPVEIYTHHFPVSIEANNVNQYDVDISTIRRDGREAFNDFRKESRSSLRCDEGKTMYTKEFLTDFKEARRVTIKMANEEKVFQFKVLNLVRQEKLANIPDFLNGKSPIYPRDAIRITETLLKQTNRNWFLSIKCKHFPRNQQWVDLSRRIKGKKIFSPMFISLHR